MSTLLATATLTLQIRCINKTDRMNSHERIKSIGGLNSDNSRWKLSLNDAIAGIKHGTYKFWVTAAGKSVWVVIARSAAGYEYLKTENDGEQPNNLLSLPECP
jgi:hypothetical protein